MLYNLEDKKQKQELLQLIDENLLIEAGPGKEKTRTQRQSIARWLWLTWIAEELTNRGETFMPYGFTKINVPYTKDNLYAIYWQTLRFNMYKGKSEQLDTKEFSDLVEMAQMMFAQVFQINITFPSLEWKILREQVLMQELRTKKHGKKK